MKWFAILSLVTVYWGNGGVEARKDWLNVFHGTRQECVSYADTYARDENARLKLFIEGQRGKGTRHAVYPSVYNSGVTTASDFTAVCVEFDSLEQMKKAGPESFGYIVWRDAKGAIDPQ